MSLAPLLQSIRKIQVIGPSGTIPSWQERGVRHGFAGVDAKEQPFFHTTQVHGAQLQEAGDGTAWQCSQRLEGDGIWTSQKDVPVAVKTADCVPLLFYTPQKVMAVHAGWKGMRANIIGAALELLPKQDLLVAIGPCISAYSFEVGYELIEEFIRSPVAWTSEHQTHIFSRGIGDRWHIDLGMAAVFNLLQRGVQAERISLMKTCTKLEPNLWHSYRRNGLEAGRNWSWIAL